MDPGNGVDWIGVGVEVGWAQFRADALMYLGRADSPVPRQGGAIQMTPGPAHCFGPCTEAGDDRLLGNDN